MSEIGSIFILMGMIAIVVNVFLTEDEDGTVGEVFKKISSSLSNKKFSSYAYEESSFLIRKFNIYIGEPLDRKAFWKTFATGFIITFIFMILLIVYRDHFDPSDATKTPTAYRMLNRVYSVLANSTGNGLGLWLSYFCTHAVVRSLSNKFSSISGSVKIKFANPLNFLFYFLLDLLLVIVMSTIALQIIFSLHDVYYYILFGEILYPSPAGSVSISLAPPKIINGIAFMLDYDQPFPSQGKLYSFAFILLVISAIPSFVHLISMIFFLIPRLKPSWSEFICKRLSIGMSKSKEKGLPIISSTFLFLGGLFTLLGKIKVSVL